MIVRSPYPEVEIPELSLTEFVLERVAEYGDRPALIDGPSGRTVTYAEFAGAVKSMAAGLAGRGFGKGDCFAIYLPNLPEYGIAFHAVAAAGGANTTVNPLYTSEELAHQLNDSKARFLLTIPQFADKAQAAASSSDLEEVFVLGESEGATPVTELLDDGEALEVDVDPHGDLVVLPYSSGTTGLPKGVMLTHHNLVANLAQSEGVLKIGREDVIIGVLPFFHIYGQTVIMNSGLHSGATIVTMPRFDLEQFLALLQKHTVTRAYLVPPIVLALAKHPLVDDFDLSSLSLIMSGAAPLGADLAAAASERLGCHVMQGYGLTETSPVTHCMSEDPAENRPGSIGPPIPKTECRVVDPATGEDAAPGESGEVLIRGPQVMKGYLNNPAATRAAIDEDGWLHSGDLGHVDEDGYFFLTDRLKELIKYKGLQVAPAELENVLLSHPQISDAAVIPVPDEEAGEIPKAFVVIDGDLSDDDIMSFVAERVAPHKKVRRVEAVDEIPKSPSGKILRRVLRDKETQAVN